jgi:hypothetical protein
MNNRPIYTDDLPILRAAIENDKFHPGQWKVEDFRGTSEVFEDSHGIVVFVRYETEPAGKLRISTMWVTPDEVHRNGRAIVFLVHRAAERAAAVGFKQLIFTTTHSPLAIFCTRVLKFRAIENNEYVLDLEGR